MNTRLKNVISFEIIRNLKKPIFWLTALFLPFLLIGYIALAGLNGYQASDALESSLNNASGSKLGIYDPSNIVTKKAQAVQTQNADQEVQEFHQFSSEEEGAQALKDNQLDIFYVLPENFTEIFEVRAYTKSDQTNLFANYETPIRQLLMEHAISRVEPLDFAIISGNFSVNTLNFNTENEIQDPMARFSKMIVPGFALILFYILIVVFGNRLTTAMTEEKENRISEMILTSISPQDLIIGKIISLIVLGFIQVAILTLPLITLFAFGHQNNFIPNNLIIDWDPWLILSSLTLLFVSYFLFAGLCVTISTLVPTAKDASSFSSVLMILVVLPLFFLSIFMSPEPQLITYILSYFPPSAPITLLIRNTLGTLPVWELAIGLSVLIISSILVVRLAVYIFKRSALEFTSKISYKNLFNKPRKTWRKTH